MNSETKQPMKSKFFEVFFFFSHIVFLSFIHILCEEKNKNSHIQKYTLKNTNKIISPKETLVLCI